MTDNNIYIGQQNKSNIGILLAVLGVTAIIALAVFLIWHHPRRPAGKTEIQTSETAQPATIDRGLSLLTAATQLQKEGKLVEARDKAFEVLDQSSNRTARAGAEALLGDVNVQLVLTPYPMPEKVDYTIQPGDSINALARKFGATVEVIQKGNRVTSSVIRPGDRLRIFSGKFSIQVS